MLAMDYRGPYRIRAVHKPDPVIERQLERTELTHSSIGQPQVDTILAAGLALQQAGVITPETDVRAAVDSLVDRRFATASR